MHPDGATGVVFKAGDLVAPLTTDKNGEAEVNHLYLGNYYVKEITPSAGDVYKRQDTMGASLLMPRRIIENALAKYNQSNPIR